MALAAVTHKDRRPSGRAEWHAVTIAILARLGTKGAIVTISTMLTADRNTDTKNHESN